MIEFDYGGLSMIIKPSTALRNNYNEISEECKRTGEPIYLTKNGEGDLVVMDIEAFTKREKMLELREKLLRIEEGRLKGEKDYSIEELEASLDNLLKKL